MGRVGEISIPNCSRFTYDRTSGIQLMAIHCAAAECGVLIKRKLIGKNVKAFPTNFGRSKKVTLFLGYSVIIGLT